jgi:lysophospholipase L1-like esterase
MSSAQLRLTLSFALIIACGLAQPQRSCLAVEKEAAAKKTEGPARFENEIAAFDAYDHKNATPHDPILFVGSSTIRLWQTADAFPGLPIINRGFGGSTTEDVNHFADRIVFKYKPRLIVFYCGDNDLAAGRTPDRVFSDIESFITSVHDRLPETPIVYLSIKPSIARWKLWSQMQDVNGRVNELTSKYPLLTYIDTAPTLLGDDGQPQKSLLRDDGLHMNDGGYAKWNAVLSEKLKSQASGR